MRTRTWFVFLIWLFPCLALAEPGFDPHAMKDWQICIVQDAVASQCYAAEEFQSLWKTATEIELPIASIDIRDHSVVQNPPGRRIYIGAAAISVLFGDTHSFASEEVGYRVEKDRIGIAGGGPRGTLYAVYELFERVFGVRFLTRDHTHVPVLTRDFIIPLDTHFHSSPFSFRWSYYKENSDDHAFATRLRVNTVATEEKYGGKTGQHLINHTFMRWMPVQTYGKLHPEYFALVEGERLLEASGGGPELCVTNPRVIELVSRAVIDHLDSHPKLENISVSQNDNDKYCQEPPQLNPEP